MWTFINIIILVFGCFLFYLGWKKGQATEAYDALLPLGVGMLLIVVGITSIASKLFWG